MYLSTDKIVATIHDVTMRSFLTSNPQFVLDATALTGWSDGVDIRRNFTPRQIRSGDFLEAGHHASRYISFSGAAIARNAEELHTMRDQFVGMVTPKEYRSLSVEDITGIRWATVTIGGKTSWVQQSDVHATFKIDLYAPDPNQYGSMQTVTLMDNYMSGGMNLPISYPMNYGAPFHAAVEVLTNNGNNDSWPVIRVFGDYDAGFTVTDNQGNYVTYGGAVRMNSHVTIDMQAGIATQDGQDRSTFLTKRDWWSIPANSSITPSFIPVQKVNGWCDILFRDTWI